MQIDKYMTLRKKTLYPIQELNHMTDYKMNNNCSVIEFKTISSLTWIKDYTATSTDKKIQGTLDTHLHIGDLLLEVLVDVYDGAAATNPHEEDVDLPTRESIQLSCHCNRVQ
jgi:hypothetical protein